MQPEQRSRAAPAAVPLKSEIRVSSGTLRGSTLSLPVSLDGLHERLQKFQSGPAANYQRMAGALSRVAENCASKTYSVAEQKAAGCAGSDTVDQCGAKLYRRCLDTNTSPVREGKDFTRAQFQDSAKGAAAEAQAMSEILARYAAQAEQAAKTFAP